MNLKDIPDIDRRMILAAGFILQRDSLLEEVASMSAQIEDIRARRAVLKMQVKSLKSLIIADKVGLSKSVVDRISEGRFPRMNVIYPQFNKRKLK